MRRVHASACYDPSELAVHLADEVERASAEEAWWPQVTLDRESVPFGAGVALEWNDTLEARW